MTNLSLPERCQTADVRIAYDLSDPIEGLISSVLKLFVHRNDHFFTERDPRCLEFLYGPCQPSDEKPNMPNDSRLAAAMEGLSNDLPNLPGIDAACARRGPLKYSQNIRATVCITLVPLSNLKTNT